ncbi:hypothetical protein V9T40_011022 [Parthenolecanium corni]|uniref:TIR domain-containing protein n=1 Tax=Parthenolecanium corni TaxID=536013 RepID=A0AAN9T689_9HEMI
MLNSIADLLRAQVTMEWSPYFVIIFTIFLLSSLVLAENQQCHPTPQCFCQNSNYGEFEYQCGCKPQQDDCNDALYMRLKPNEEIRISCNSLEEWVSTVKELNVSGLYKKMTLYNCTLPQTSFTQMLQDLGIVGVIELQLDFLNNANSAFKDGYFDGLTSVKYLYIQHSSVQSLPDGVFHGLTNLERLYLDNNKLKTLTPALFKSLSRLWYLEIGRNELTHLPRGTFKYVANLTLLNAYSNHLHSLTRDVFADVPKLKYLDVQSNAIQSLDDDVFVDLPLLADVNLSFNNISHLSDSIFANKALLNRIRATQAQGSNVTALPPNLFANLTTLKTLKLDYNSLQYLPNNLFYKTRNLTFLTLKNNKMTSLGEYVFKDAPNLETLDLGHNNLTTLNASVFSSLTKLVHLYLDNNQLEFLDRSIFQSLTSLNRLYMNHNRLTSLEPQLFSSLARLKLINLSYNHVNMSSGIEDFSVLNNCREIENIDLSYNNVSRIYRDWLIVFIYLKDLDLSHNQIDKLNTGARALTYGIDEDVLVSYDVDGCANFAQVTYHFSVLNSIALELARRGHNVTVYSRYSATYHTKNYRHIELKDCFPLKNDNSRYNSVEYISDYGGILGFIRFVLTFIPSSEALLSCEPLMKLVNTTDQYDALLLEAYNGNTDIYVGLSYKLNAPYIGVSSTMLYPWLSERMGTPDNPSYIPVPFTGFTSDMNFWQRTANTVAYLVSKLVYNYVSVPQSEAVARRIFGNDMPPLQQLLENCSLIFTYTHPSISPVRPLVPNVVEIAGVNIDEQKKLPENIEKFINESEHGVVYFSMGSFIHSRLFPKKKLEAFLDAFSKIPQRVIWKWEGDPDSINSDKILAGAWMPQKDILDEQVPWDALDKELLEVRQKIEITCAVLDEIPNFTTIRVPNRHKHISIQNCSLDKTSFHELMQKFVPENIEELEMMNVARCTNILKDGYFANLKPLKNLSIRNNKIRMFNETAFEGMENIRKFEISHNNLESLTSEIVKSMQKLRVLDLGYNQLQHLPDDVFKHVHDLYTLKINNNYLNTLTRKVFQNLTNLKVLNLSDNRITHLSHDVFHEITSLENISMSNNIINNFPQGMFANNTLLKKVYMTKASGQNTTSLPENLFVYNVNLSILYLDNNNLISLPNGLFSSLGNLKTLKLSNNNLTELSEIIFRNNGDLEELHLDNNMLSKFNNEIKVYMYSHKMLRWLVAEREIDRDKIYDAFVSYSHLDEWFVSNELVPELESGPNPYKLCIHYRDWLAGAHIPTQIHRSVKDSRRTIIILSPNFLTSFWGKMEFHEAYIKAMKERCPRVIVILLKDIDDKIKLDDELKVYLRTYTYIKWHDSRFWPKLKYALPHKHNRE